MNNYIKKVGKNLLLGLIIIAVIVGWYVLYYICGYSTDLILEKFEWFLIFILFLVVLYFIKLVVTKDKKGLKELFKILIIIAVIIGLFFLWNRIRYQKIELPDGSIVVLDCFFNNHSVRIGITDYCFDNSGNCRVADSKTNKTIKWLNNYEIPRYLLLKIEYAENY